MTTWTPILNTESDYAQEQLPHERALCAAFLLAPSESVSEWKCRVSGIDNPGSMIRDERHRLLIAKLIKLHKAGVNCFDHVTLRDRCDDDEILSFGGWGYIVGHQEYLLMGAGFHKQMDHLISRHQVLSFQSLASFAMESVVDQSSLNDAVAMLNQKATALIRSESDMITPDEDVVHDTFDRLTKADAEPDTIPTTFRKLSESVGDYRRGQITVVGAPPGNGKTAFAMQEIQTALKHGFVVDAFLMESSFEQFTERYIMRNAVVHGSKFKTKFFSRDELRRIHDCMEMFSRFKNRLHLSKQGGVTAYEIDSMIQARKAATGMRCDMIVVDHLKRMRHTAEKGQSQYNAETETLQHLSNIAARENAVMLLMDQLSVDAVRNSFGKNSKFPGMGAFRGGTVTEFAKVMIILHKDEQDMLKASLPVVEQHMVVVKANDGSSGAIPSLFLKPFTMHIEDSGSTNRQDHATWLQALNYDMNTRRKDPK